MLQHLRIQGYKSINDLEVTFPRLTVLFGANAASKSNLLEAVQILSRIATQRTISEALAGPIRGYPMEAFAFPPGGLQALFEQSSACFRLEATMLGPDQEPYRYCITVQFHPASGNLIVGDEYLAVLTRKGTPKGKPVIERGDGQLRVRRKGKSAPPRRESVGLNHALLSEPRLGGDEYRIMDRCRAELEGWRIYYLDPRTAMRSAQPPIEVRDIGVLGEAIAVESRGGAVLVGGPIVVSRFPRWSASLARP